jgi:AcrR family transcriptional regulator
MVEHSKTDGRRELGEQTRQRLLEATRVLLAERGEDAVTLRDITQAACANVAAASYHFGSLAALRRAAIEQAIETLVESQIDGFRALDDDAGVEQIAAAFAQPLIAAFTHPESAKQASLRIMARVAPNPPPELEDWITATIARADAELFPRLRRALPGVTDQDLHFRIQAVAGIIHHLVRGRMRVDVHDKSANELERLLIPVISGVLTGGDPKPPSRARSSRVRRSVPRRSSA